VKSSQKLFVQLDIGCKTLSTELLMTASSFCVLQPARMQIITIRKQNRILLNIFLPIESKFNSSVYNVFNVNDFNAHLLHFNNLLAKGGL
jgi:hypothetical protein